VRKETYIACFRIVTRRSKLRRVEKQRLRWDVLDSFAQVILLINVCCYIPTTL
jgi:hypothetical protein